VGCEPWYRKLPFLKELWQQIPKATATGYFNDCKSRLTALWEESYKNREIEDEIEPPSLVDVINYNSYTSQRMRYRNSRQQARDPSQHSGRRRRHATTAHIADELVQYLGEPQVPTSLYNGDPMMWWREVGSKRFPRLSFLAADLLSIPPSAATNERDFNMAGDMVRAKRSSLTPHIVHLAPCLGSWRRYGIYVPSKTWQYTDLADTGECE
jgi:hypothetical protein